jgi:predicted phage-related endonuclease
MTGTTTTQIELSAEFHQLLEDRKAVSETIKAFEESKKQIDEQIKGVLAEAGTKELKTAQWSVKISESVRKSLDEKLLLQNGVSVGVIQASKKETPVVSLRVTEIKEK